MMPAHSHEHDLPLRVANRASGGPETHDQDLAARVVEPSDRSRPLAFGANQWRSRRANRLHLLFHNLSLCDSD